MLCVKSMFNSCGKNVIFYPFDSFSYSNISIGDYVFIGKGAVFHSSESIINIGNKVMFGPRVTIIGGNHNTAEVGKYMFDVKNKRADDDMPVVVEDDVWVGAGVTILKGTTIGRGSIVAAGSVVRKTVPPYSIIAGVPAKVINTRFDHETIILHEEQLYREKDRLGVDVLNEGLFKKSKQL